MHLPRLALLAIVAGAFGCATSVDTVPEPDTGLVADSSTDTGASDTGTPKDSSVPKDTYVADTWVDYDTGVVADSDFPDFGTDDTSVVVDDTGGGTDGGDGGDGAYYSVGACTIDTDCVAPFDCCVGGKCGTKFGESCIPF